MGIESFYLNVELQDNNIDFIDNLIKSNKTYRDFIAYHIDEESNEFCLQAAMVSFFPICEIIYDLCNKINKENPIKNIHSRKVNVSFDFENSFAFFCWMYSVWKESLTYFHNNWGAFLIHPTNYYKARRKLRKKYFIKYILNGR